jgi:hypothetical protein
LQLKLGQYEFDSNACFISTRMETVWSAGGEAIAYRYLWTVEGYLSGSSQTDLTTKALALETQLKRQDLDLIFYRDDGGESANFLHSRGSMTGIRITRGPDFTNRNGSEYATERTFSFEAEAEYPTRNDSSVLMSWEEELETGGGYPLIIHRPAINAPPQKQIVFQQMPYTATQSGAIVGYLKYPSVPPPLFPAHLKEAPVIHRRSPERRKPGNHQGFSVTYRYVFESATPLVGLPTLWR